VQAVASPVIICGDIHGQFYDLLELFRLGGPIPNNNYIFMGDFVDRGLHSVETLVLLLVLKARYPGNITLLRGNHESRQITQVYGFCEEVLQKYGNASVYMSFSSVFDFMCIAAIVDGRVLCVHGGLSPDVSMLDQISTIDRMQEVPHEGPFCDLLWSDPEDIDDETWMISPRGAGYLFGGRVTAEFNHINSLELLARSHQLVQEGFRYHFSSSDLVTVWSAANYCYRCGNVAAILCLDENLNREFKICDAVPNQQQQPATATTPPDYFI